MFNFLPRLVQLAQAQVGGAGLWGKFFDLKLRGLTRAVPAWNGPPGSVYLCLLFLQFFSERDRGGLPEINVDFINNHTWE